MTNAEYYLKEETRDEFFETYKKYLKKKLNIDEEEYTSGEDIIATFMQLEAKPTLTEDERVILRNVTLGDELPEMIARDDWGRLYLKNKNDTKRWSLWTFCHLFQFIKERRRIRDSRTIERRIKMTMKDLLKIINHYGLKPQLKYLHTEHYELDEACLIGTKDNVAEELADMFVMLFQIQEYFNINDNQLDEIMEHKIERQLKRIEDEQNANK